MDPAEYMRKWRAKNADKWNAYMREWRAQNADHITKSRREYYQKNREVEAAKALKRQHENKAETKLLWKVSKANQYYPGKLTLQDVRNVIARCGRKCHWCGKGNLRDRDLTLEHLRPINDPQFLTIACHACNTSKCYLRGGKRVTEAEKKEAAKQRHARWCAENADYVKEKAAEYREKNREHLREYHREWSRKRREATKKQNT